MLRRNLMLDQNYLRADELRMLVRDTRNRFILPDELLLEMCKSEQWESTLVRSLEILSEAPTRVKMTTSLGVALKWETSHGKSIAGRLVEREATEFIRRVLAGVRDRKMSDEVNVMRVRMAKAQTEMQIEEFNHVENRNSLVQLVNTAKQFLTPEFQKRLRSSAVSREELQATAIAIAPQIVEHHYLESGFSREKIRAFIRSKPLSLRLAYASLINCMEWVAGGGLDSYAAVKATNDGLDRNYAVLATFFDGLLTKDGKAGALYKHVSEMVAR